MKKHLLILIALLVAGSGFAQKAQTVKLIQSTEQRVVVNFQLNKYTTDKVKTPQGDQFIVNAPDMASMLEAGAPNLPTLPIPVLIGDRAEMSVKVIDAQYTDYSNMAVAPSKGNISRQINPDDVPYTYGEMYQQDAFWPAAQATLDAPYILRDFRGQNIMVHPFAYNPVTKTLRVYTNMTIEMTKVSDNGENQKVARKDNGVKTSPEFKASYGRRFINFGAAAAKYPFVEDDGEMLVICADQFMTAMQPFVDWKNESGRPTTMVSVTEVGGNNADVIKTYITNYYNSPDHNLVYVLFVGDYQHITPHPFAYNDGMSSTQYSDIWFGQIEGNDNYPEVFVGRFSVQSDDHVNNHVNKVLYYERDLQGDITWGDKGLGIGSALEGSGGHFGEYDAVHIDFIRDTLLHYTYNTVTDLHQGGSGASNATAAGISNVVNQGVSIINYCNHGSETSWGVANYSNSHVNALTNDNMWPIIWSVACLNGKFGYSSDCFAEAWMRATDNSTGAPTGAIGGMFSWLSQPWQPPMYGQDEMNNILTEWRNADRYNHTLSGASLNGNMDVLDKGGSTGAPTHNAWILFGDPSLMLRTANPTSMNVSLEPAVLMIGMNSLEVSAEDTPYGIATLSNEEGVLASAKIIDGTATLEFPALNAVETLTLTVIGFNKVTERMNVEVLPAEGAFVSVAAFTPGNVPVNEEQHMSMSFKNVGVDPTMGATSVVLSSQDENITFSDNEASFDILGANETITLEDAFAFTVAPGVPDGTKIQIDVTMTCGTDTWSGKAKITVGAPIIEFDNFQCMGGFTPGEAQNVVASFKNIGHYMATNAVVTISSRNEHVSFASETIEIGTINAESIGNALFSVIVDDSCPETDQILLEFNLEADNEIIATGTGMLKNTCNVVFELTDSYGDGWNGNKLIVNFSDGSPTQNLTIDSGNSASYTLEIGKGTHVTLSWQNGNYTYECSFSVRYENGDEITTAANLNAGYHFEFDVNCGGSSTPVDMLPVNNLEYSIDSVNATLALSWEAMENVINYLILRNGEQIGTTSENFFIDSDPKESSEYCVVAQYLSGNSEPVCFLVGEIWGVDQLESEIRIYPNPVNGTLFIQGSDSDYTYVLYNGMGQQVANGTARGLVQINVQAMTKGVYFLQLTTGTQVSTQKVVVK